MAARPHRSALRRAAVFGALALLPVSVAVVPGRAAPAAPAQITPSATPAPGGGIVQPGARVTRVATGFVFTEGPAADSRGDVFFSDVRGNRIHKWSAQGAVTVYREPSGGANGLYFDPDGHLVVCESTNRRVTSDDLAGDVRVLADRYGGKRLNSPNDVWVRPDGGIYFSDPRYGDETGVEQDGMHVYYIPPDGSPLRRVTNDLAKPNGLIGTPDGLTLYIADAGAGQVWRYRVLPDGNLADKTAYVRRTVDGMTMDARGNVYLATALVEVFDPAGAPVATIAVAEQPTNVTFGGPTFRTLFVTARTSVYSLAMAVSGAGAPVVPEPTATATPSASATVPPPSDTPTMLLPSTTPTTSPSGTSTPGAAYLPRAERP